MINWPTSKGIDLAIKKMPTDPARFVGQTIAPIVNSAFHEVEYFEIYGPQGMTYAHNLDDDPRLIKPAKIVKKSFKPAYFKEASRIGESDILKLRTLGGTEYQAATAQELIGRHLDDINIRIETRIEWMRWQALLTGEVNINENGIVINAAYGVPAGNLAKQVSVAWSDKENSKPIEDILEIRKAYEGTGFKLKYILMNSTTAALFSLSEDTKDHYNGSSLKEKLLPGNLSAGFSEFFPGLCMVVYDEGYVDSNGTFQKFIPDNKIVFLGDAPAGEIIDVVSVPSVHTPSGDPLPGKFAFAIDRSGQQEANPYYEIVGGFYGLPRIRRPELLMVMDVTDVAT